MISSLMSRMADAEKLDLPQLQEAIQNGTIPPYIGIPLVQDKTRQAQQMKLAMAGQQAQQMQGQPPIAEQIMAQARGLENLPTNLPQSEQEYAAGGVVAFAGPDGSYVGEDDDEEDIGYGGLSKQEEALLAEYLADIEASSEEGAVPQAVAEVPQAKEYQYGINPYKKGASEGIQYTDKKHKYENQIRETARKAGVPEELFLHMMTKETGGLSNPESAVSKAGAMGIAQFMPATAKQYGIDPMDVNQALPAAAKMVSGLLKKYDGNERLAAMAYNWGQGNVDKWLSSGADPAKLPRETAGYIRAAEGGIMNLAAGGAIAFEEGGKAKDKEKEQTEKDREDFMMGLKKLGASAADVFTLPVRGVMGAANTGIRGIRAMGADVPYIPEEAFGGSSSSLTPYYDRIVRAKEQQAQQEAPKPQFNVQPPMQETGPTRKELGLPEADMRYEQEKDLDAQIAAQKKDSAKGDEELQSIKDMLKERQASAKNQKEIDAYMALLQAGLGMMAGTSPYAMTNIGKGASTGIEAALASRKNQISEENAILSGQLGLSRAQLLEKSRQNALARQIALDKQRAAQYQQTYGLNALKVGAQQQANALKARKQYMDEGGEQSLRKRYEDKYGKNFSVDPRLNFQFQQEMRSEINALANIVGSEESGGAKSSSEL